MLAPDAAADAIRALIAQREYAPGERLPSERELAARFGVSRPVVREAIGRLVAGGLLRTRRGAGTYVAPIDLADVFAVRLELEPFAARLAARNRSEPTVRMLRRHAARLSPKLEPAAFAALDRAIHREIVEAAANPVLLEVLERLAELTSLSRAVTVGEPEARAAATRDVRALVAAIADGDAAGAGRAMRRHLTSVRRLGLR